MSRVQISVLLVLIGVPSAVKIGLDAGSGDYRTLAIAAMFTAVIGVFALWGWVRGEWMVWKISHDLEARRKRGDC